MRNFNPRERVRFRADAILFIRRPQRETRVIMNMFLLIAARRDWVNVHIENALRDEMNGRQAGFFARFAERDGVNLRNKSVRCIVFQRLKRCLYPSALSERDYAGD